MENDYDSINLASTLKSELKATSSPGQRSPYQQKIPVSESESYDDDEFEHDPEEFITNKHGDSQLEPIFQDFASRTTDEQDDQLAGSNNTLRLGSLHLSELLPPSNSQNFDEPIQHLSGRIKALEGKLIEHSQVYSTLLREGDSNVAEMRSVILQIFHQLSECYFSLNELYSKDMSYTKSVNTYFDAWNLKHDRVLSKIKREKSERSTHGAKLSRLLNESTALDDDIDELQQRVAVLQKKKLVLNKEIEDTTSVLESKTATYGENLRYLEQNGREILQDYLHYNGLPESDFTTLLKEQTIDLSFSMPKRSTFDVATNFEHPHSNMPRLQPNANTTPISSVGNGGSIGMKPYEPPLVPSSPTLPSQKPLPLHDESLMNHGHGPTAFEKGYAIGAQNSKLLKSQVQSFLHNVVSHVPKKSEVSQLKHLNRTVTTTLDVEPITTFLRLRVDALSDLVISTSKKAAYYHDCDKQWSQIQRIISLQEEQLERILKESKADEDITPVINALNQTRAQLELAMKPILLLNLGGVLSQLVRNEVEAVTEALSIVSKGKSMSQKQS
ncbi:hypothetical protein CANMA_002380 [Candida margitis]|uniref:uncharacterized protein n=1 Tax=Candida margitis TaxID=1775924 RepID=UPI0022263D0F|nr:uncharacterized protein CANMA_002380 [Candida margitis]KAI5968389.1 hypothetical protein CANMA_002380 [Candida margitis]